MTLLARTAPCVSMLCMPSTAEEVCAYLRARYDAEQHLALEGSWDTAPARWHVGRRGLMSTVSSDAGLVAEVRPADAEHMVVWDPHRVANETAMKRTLLAEVEALAARSRSRAARHAAREMLRALLIPYRQRADCPRL
jgi:Family of unknown function (DUF6221)